MTHRVISVEDRLAEAEARLDAIEAIAHAMSSQPMDEFIALVMRTLSRHIPAERSSLLLIDDSGTRLRVCGTYQTERSEAPPLDYSLPIAVNAGESGIGLSVHAFLTGQPYFWNERTKDPIHIPELARRINARETLVVPLVVSGESVGVFHLTNSRRGRFTENDTRFLVGISGQVAAMLRECQLREALRTKNEQLEKSMVVHEDFISAVVQGRGVNEIAALLANLLGLAVVVRDRASNLLAATVPDCQALESWSDVVDGMCRSLERDRLAAILRLGSRGDSLVRIGACGPAAGQYQLFGVPVAAGKNNLGLIAVATNRELHELDKVAVKQAAAALALRLTQEQHEFMTIERLRGGLLSDIMRGDLATDSVVFERAALLGYKLSPPFRAIVVDLGRSHEEQGAKGFATSDPVCQLIGRRWPGLVSCRRGKSIVILASGEEARDSGRIAMGIVAQVREGYPGTKAWCGTGDICDSLRDAKASYEQARMAARVAKDVGADNNVLDYNALGFYRLLLNVSETGQLEDYVIRHIEPLLRHDKDKGSKYVDTLKAFFKYRGSNKRVAAALNVHMNTLQYRLRRIEELCGVSLDDQDVAFELHLALKALPFVRMRIET